MSPIERFKISIVTVVVLFAGNNVPKQVFAAEPATPTHCGAPSYRQFDFWAGDWDVFDVGSPIQVAQARVDLILDGCVLREDYQGTDGHKGQSFTIYDAARDVWHQTWVTNRGELLQIEGKLDAGVMILSGEDHAKHTLVRGWWKPANGEVRETAATSEDNGKTWKPWFDLVFRPKTSVMIPTSVADDKKIIAALDTQYQLAVKENDAATMNRILADDFILVTGSGKTYSEADLLAEARSGHVHYERQDDTSETVRILADTAVITALLTEKGTDAGKPFDKTVWFGDTYLRNAAGWRYQRAGRRRACGQALGRSREGENITMPSSWPSASMPAETGPNFKTHARDWPRNERVLGSPQVNGTGKPRRPKIMVTKTAENRPLAYFSGVGKMRGRSLTAL